MSPLCWEATCTGRRRAQAGDGGDVSGMTRTVQAISLSHMPWTLCLTAVSCDAACCWAGGGHLPPHPWASLAASADDRSWSPRGDAAS